MPRDCIGGGGKIREMERLKKKAWLGLLLTGVVMALLVFVSAGTVRYWQAWVYLTVFLGVSTGITLHLMRTDSALLERRLSGGPLAEKGKVQRIVMTLASAGFIGLLVLPALDNRFGWSHVPPSLVIAGDVLTLLGFYVTFRVYEANTFASATIQVTSGQRVISTGPYAIVRHPMYAGGLIYLLGMPIALGSYWGLLVFVAMVPALIWRLVDEEKFLVRNLPGYVEYQARVRWRLIPKVF
jgi:protein-S-isoprenylcysteine O-methyltransferase Ste14